MRLAIGFINQRFISNNLVNVKLSEPRELPHTTGKRRAMGKEGGKVVAQWRGRVENSPYADASSEACDDSHKFTTVLNKTGHHAVVWMERKKNRLLLTG